MTHPERVEDYKAIRAIAEQAIAAQESTMVNPWRVLNLLDALTASEKRASEAERTFADLRELIAVNIAANAELVRERDAAQTALAQASNMWTETVLNPVLSERDSARAALGKVVEVATKVMIWADSMAQYVDDGMPVVPWAGELRTALTHMGKKEIKE